MEGCTLHSLSGSCMGCIFIQKGGASSKHLSADMFGLEEVESCNLAQMGSISGL